MHAQRHEEPTLQKQDINTTHRLEALNTPTAGRRNGHLRVYTSVGRWIALVIVKGNQGGLKEGGLNIGQHEGLHM